MCVFCTLKKKKKKIYLKDISKKRAKINLHCQLPPTVLSKEFSPLPSPGPPQLSSSATACCWGCHSGDKLDPAQETSPPSQASHLLAAHIPQGFVLPDHALRTVRHVTGSRFRQCVTHGLAGSFHSNGHLKQQHKGRQRMTPHPWGAQLSGWDRQVWKGCQTPAGMLLWLSLPTFSRPSPLRSFPLHIPCNRLRLEVALLLLGLTRPWRQPSTLLLSLSASVSHHWL